MAITELNPNVSDIEFVDYYFHKKVDRYTKSELTETPALPDGSSIVDNTHPKVFIGGYTDVLSGGHNSGGSYPWNARWINAGEFYVDDYVYGTGVVVTYNQFQDGDGYNKQGLELLKDPQYEDYDTHPWLS